MTSLRITLALFVLAVSSACAQGTLGSAALAFDLASVRPSNPDSSPRTNVPLDSGNVYSTVDPDEARTAAGGYLIAVHQPLWRYISFAYKLSGTQELAFRFNIFSGVPKSGAPIWVTGSFSGSPECFDISARAPAATSIDQMRLMMQTLLSDRFHLVTRSISADAPVFALVLVKHGLPGPKLVPHPTSDLCVTPLHEQSSASPDRHAVAIGDLPPIEGIIAHVPSSEPGQHYGGRAVPLSLIATSIPTMTGLAAVSRPVVDQTGLSGLYDFTLTWLHDTSRAEVSVADNSANFRNALKRQLGLELKPSHASMSFLMIDKVERPSEN